jgi:IMP dehydrogenase
MKMVSKEPGYSLKDFRILPAFTSETCKPEEISLITRLCRRGDNFIYLSLPFISAAMHAVTGVEMAAALSTLGGVGVLPLISSIEEQCRLLRAVKQHKAGFQTDLINYPETTVDARKRHCIGAAVSTHPEDRERIQALVQNEVDFLVIDSAHGFTCFQKETLAWIKRHTQVPVVAGNIVTAEAFQMLAELKADAVKIGMGIGSGCTTQAAKATGRGQATAVMEIAAARNAYFEKSHIYIPLIADGGINSPADIAVALALGADTVMMGNFFARFSESPGKVLKINGDYVKEYWMEASNKARNYRRYHQSAATFFEEGVSGYVPYEGSIFDSIPFARQRLKATLSTAGAANIQALHQNAVLELQTLSALEDGRVHDMIMLSHGETTFPSESVLPS